MHSIDPLVGDGACMALHLGRTCDLNARHDGNHQAQTMRGLRSWSDEDHAGVENVPTPSEPLLSAVSPESEQVGDRDSTPACPIDCDAHIAHCLRCGRGMNLGDEMCCPGGAK